MEHGKVISCGTVVAKVFGCKAISLAHIPQVLVASLTPLVSCLLSTVSHTTKPCYILQNACYSKNDMANLITRSVFLRSNMNFRSQLVHNNRQEVLKYI